MPDSGRGTGIPRPLGQYMLTQTYTVGIDGLTLGGMIGLDGADTAALVAAGKPVPAPILARALIDTGSDVTCVTITLLRRLGLRAYPKMAFLELRKTG